MEDYESNILNDSKNEWSIRLMNILSGHIIDGFRSIFNESLEVCEKNDEAEKYLMTFQNFLSMIPKWNQNMVDTEVTRIKQASQCNYLEDLITCVHVLQLKILSCVRTSNKNQKIDIDIPCFKSFLHLVYINIARKLYSNIYLFQIDVSPLEQQKNNREFELIVQTCIMNTIRDSIPIELLLKQYIDETQEIDVETTEKIVREPETKTDVSSSETETETKNDVSIDDNKKGDTVESVFSDSNKNEVVGEKDTTSSESVSFKDLPDMTTSELDTSTPKMEGELENTEIISLDDDTSDITNDVLKIGEDVPLKLDTDFDNNANVEPELQEATLKIEESPIDLGIEELTI